MRKGRARERAMLSRSNETSGLICEMGMSNRKRVKGAQWNFSINCTAVVVRRGCTPVVDRKRERRSGEVKHTATLEKAVMMTAIARLPLQLEVKGKRWIREVGCRDKDRILNVIGKEEQGNRVGGGGPAGHCNTHRYRRSR